MSEREKIRFTVGRMRRTRRWQVLLDFLVAGLFWGAIPAALAILASRIWAIPFSEYWLAGGLLAAVAVGFAIASFFVPLTWAVGTVPILLFYALVKGLGAFLEWRDKKRREGWP